MTRITALLLLVVTAWTPWAPLAGGGENIPTVPKETVEISLVEGGPHEQARLDEAIARFTEADLDLPALDVLFLDDASGCSGSDGLFQERFTPWRVSICSDRAFVLPHELAHAWVAANLSVSDRREYMKTRELMNWNDHGQPWSTRATEDAAFVVQQNLMVEPGHLSKTWNERADAYELLTGRISPLRTQQ